MKALPSALDTPGMASVKPDDRDRGLRLVGAVTSAVTAVSLVAVGVTTGLAARHTRHVEQLAISANIALRSAGAATAGPSTGTAPVGEPAPTSTATPKAATKPK